MKYKKLEFLAVEYRDGWSLWLKRDEKKIMIGSAIKKEEELDQLISNIGIEKEHREKIDVEKEELKRKVDGNEEVYIE